MAWCWINNLSAAVIQSICEVYVQVHILCSVQVFFVFLWYVGATIKSTGGDSHMKWPGMLVGNFELNP